MGLKDERGVSNPGAREKLGADRGNQGVLAEGKGENVILSRNGSSFLHGRSALGQSRLDAELVHLSREVDFLQNL